MTVGEFQINLPVQNQVSSKGSQPSNFKALQI